MADTYPVGVLRTIQITARALTRPGLTGKRLTIIRQKWRTERRYLALQVKARDWRAVRNNFNGYLCEHDGHPHNCGRGWTKRAAIRRADRLCAEVDR